MLLPVRVSPVTSTCTISQVFSSPFPFNTRFYFQLAYLLQLYIIKFLKILLVNKCMIAHVTQWWFGKGEAINSVTWHWYSAQWFCRSISLFAVYLLSTSVNLKIRLCEGKISQANEITTTWNILYPYTCTVPALMQFGLIQNSTS
jgi:hypothetical protein